MWCWGDVWEWREYESASELRRCRGHVAVPEFVRTNRGGYVLCGTLVPSTLRSVRTDGGLIEPYLITARTLP